jgi:ParB/RepB/Spo0J family partition protein
MKRNTSHEIVDIVDIRPDPNQPRKYFKKAALESLARSLVLVGQLQPISVRRLARGEKHRFEIIDGERRWRASKIANRTTITVSIEEAELDERQRHLLSTVSNFHREGHTHPEISDALQYQRARGATPAELAENLARSESWVYQYLSLQALAPEIREKFHPETPKTDQLRFGEAVVLASLTHEQQRDLWQECRSLDRESRIVVMRQRAAAYQGRERLGRPIKRSEHRARLDRAIGRLCSHVDVLLELKEREFEQMLHAAEPAQLNRLTDQLTKLRADIGIMASAIENAAGRMKAAA